MSHTRSLLVILAAAFFLGGPDVGQAGQEVQADYKMEQPVLESAFPFEKGAREVQVGVGYFTSFNTGQSLERPDLDFAVGTVRHGWMLTSASTDGGLSGNLELLVDLYGGGVTEGPDGLLAGATLVLRYNIVPAKSKLIPYVQIGAGGFFNNIYEKNRTQRAIGSGFEFNLETSLGLRYLCSERCAIFAEAGVRHISNANTASRNNGLNSAGGVVGVSFFY